MDITKVKLGLVGESRYVTYICTLNSQADDKPLDFSKFKTPADDNINQTHKIVLT